MSRDLDGLIAETIVAAAIRHDGVVYSVPAPGRHHDVIRLMADQGFGPRCMHDQGFVASDGRFLNRIGALRVAKEAGQIKRKTGPADKLFSEDLW